MRLLRRGKQFVVQNPRLILSLVMVVALVATVAVTASFDGSGIEVIETADMNVTTHDGGSGSTGPPGA